MQTSKAWIERVQLAKIYARPKDDDVASEQANCQLKRGTESNVIVRLGIKCSLNIIEKRTNNKHFSDKRYVGAARITVTIIMVQR